MSSAPAVLVATLALALRSPWSGPILAAAPAASCEGRPATVVGTSGDDHLVGTSGPDVIVGLGGDDRILAGIDSWWVDRGGANRLGDRVRPGPGDDYVDLGADRRPGFGYLRRDSLVYRDLGHTVHADLRPTVGTVEADGVDTIRVRGQLGVIGTRYGDTLVGSPKADTLVGGWGDDDIDGRGGDDDLQPDYYDQPDDRADDDTASGGNGRDTIDTWSGHDTVAGGPGRDFVTTQGNPLATVDLGTGDDQLNATVRPRGGFDHDARSGHDTLVLDFTRRKHLPVTTIDLGSGAVTLGGSATGFLRSFEVLLLLADAPWRIHATDADERVEAGGRFAVKAWMAGGDDAVFASNRDDYVDSGAGDDLVWAYQGTDTCLNTERARSCEIRQ